MRSVRSIVLSLNLILNPRNFSLYFIGTFYLKIGLYLENRLYWCDSGLNDIAVIDTNGTSVLTLFTAAELEPFGMILVHDELIVSDRHRKYACTLNSRLNNQILNQNTEEFK